MAYASVASLMRTIEPFLTSDYPMQSLVCHDHRQTFLNLHQKVSSLEVSLKEFEKNNYSGKMTNLEVQIKKVANAVEYTIQLRVTEVATADNEKQKKKAHQRLCQSLQQVANEIHRVQKELNKIQDKGKQASKESLVQDYSSSGKDILNAKNNMVGRVNQRKRLLKQMTQQHGGSSGELKVIPIIGREGIGKTTLAKELYNDANIQSHFDVHAWATITQQYNVEEILLSLLQSIKGVKVNKDDVAELANMLQKSLKRNRYLIVLDNMWTSGAWDDVKHCFPSDDTGSRILLTSRYNDVACYAGTENLSLPMDFMDTDESWNLFRSIAFANETLPSEFETIGKQIVNKCDGLPLTIVMVAGLLSKSKRTIQVWEKVAEDVMSFVTNDPEKRCMQVLRLSYNYLTSDLKACLLYFGIFQEDGDISVKKLVRLWMAEGFLKLEKDLEREAEKCLKDLIGRNLVLIGSKSLDETTIRSCKVPDLIYEFCLRELSQGQGAFVMNDIVFDCHPSECHHLSRHKISLKPFKRWTEDDLIKDGYYRALLPSGHHQLIRRQTGDTNLLKHTRSIFSFRLFCSFTLQPEHIHFNFLRVLDLSPTVIHAKNFPEEILGLIWLRYLAFGRCLLVSSEIGRLRNLQTFISIWGSYRCHFKKHIWELMQLRHLKLHRFYLPNPPVDKEKRCVVFANIQTISGLSPRSCRKRVISGILTVKKLAICGDEDEYKTFQEHGLVNNLVHLHQLEILKFELRSEEDPSNDDISPAMIIPSAEVFPATLKKLNLSMTCLRWEDLNIIGELPNLEMLKLIYFGCRGEEWDTVPGGFTQLKHLLIGKTDLKNWKATKDSFPVLEYLMIRSCKYLEIPIEFAAIKSLKLIEIDECSPKVEASAERVQEKQEYMGNKPVHVRILKDPASEEEDSAEASDPLKRKRKRNKTKRQKNFLPEPKPEELGCEPRKDLKIRKREEGRS